MSFLEHPNTLLVPSVGTKGTQMGSIGWGHFPYHSSLVNTPRLEKLSQFSISKFHTYPVKYHCFFLYV